MPRQGRRLPASNGKRLIKNVFHNNFISPLFCAALSACAGFYILFFAHTAVIITIIIISVFALSFFRALAMSNFLFAEDDFEILRLSRIIYVCSVSISVSLVLGICAANAGKNEIKFGLPEDKITAIEGVLLEDPRMLSSGAVMASVSLKKSTAIFAAGNNASVSSSGVITVFFPQESDDGQQMKGESFSRKLREFGRGTVVFAEGKIRSNDRGISFTASSLHITEKAPAVESLRTNIRINLMNRFDGKSWGGLALALLVGIRDNLDVNLTTVYRDAGLSYILALSGMHLAVITALIAFLLKKPLGLKAASITGAVIICLYCLLVGPMPSLVRSAIMYLLGVFTILTSVPKKSLSVLYLSFLIQIVLTPAAGNSLSFILSYAALLGILITSRHISSLLGGVIPEIVLQPLALSCGAFLATAGICAFSFRTIAPIGIIAGLAIVPLTTIFMIGSIIWLLLDIFSISFILNLPLILVYRSMEIISSIAGYVPGIRVNPVIILILSIGLIMLIAFLSFKRQKTQVKLMPFS